MPANLRVGIIGFGYIGKYLYEQLMAHPEWGLEPVFIATRATRCPAVPANLLLTVIEEARTRRPDLIVEAAHASIVTQHGAQFLEFADLMPLSLTALSDAATEASMLDAAARSGRCLYVPHGAAVGLDSLHECRDLWQVVTVVMKKNPRNLDFSAAPGIDPSTITDSQVLYDGPTRGACAMFPRNVNAHAATALAGIGFDRTRSVLIADPALDVSVIQLEARGEGVQLFVERSNPLQGVSGILTLRSIIGAVQRVRPCGTPMQIC